MLLYIELSFHTKNPMHYTIFNFFWNYNMGIFYLHLFFCPPYMITPKKNSPPFFYVEHFLSNCNNAKKKSFVSTITLLLMIVLQIYIVLSSEIPTIFLIYYCCVLLCVCFESWVSIFFHCWGKNNVLKYFQLILKLT